MSKGFSISYFSFISFHCKSMINSNRAVLPLIGIANEK
jgi:hypothetical protein